MVRIRKQRNNQLDDQQRPEVAVQEKCSRYQRATASRVCHPSLRGDNSLAKNRGHDQKRKRHNSTWALSLEMRNRRDTGSDYHEPYRDSDGEAREQQASHWTPLARPEPSGPQEWDRG